MDLLLTVLGVFGLIPIATMSFFYGVIPVVLIGLQVLGVAEALRERSSRSEAPVEAQAPSLDRAA